MIKIGKKWDKEAQYIGRGSPLGNPFIMRDGSGAERDRVCNAYAAGLDEQILGKNPTVLAELRRLYRLAKAGDITLGCFCAPKRCHGESVAAFLNKYL